MLAKSNKSAFPSLRPFVCLDYSPLCLRIMEGKFLYGEGCVKQEVSGGQVNAVVERFKGGCENCFLSERDGSRKENAPPTENMEPHQIVKRHLSCASVFVDLDSPEISVLEYCRIRWLSRN